MNTIYSICLAVLVSVQFGIVNGGEKTVIEEPDVGAAIAFKHKDGNTERGVTGEATVIDPTYGDVHVQVSAVQPQNPEELIAAMQQKKKKNRGKEKNKLQATTEAKMTTEDAVMCTNVKLTYKNKQGKEQKDERPVCRKMEVTFGVTLNNDLKPGETRVFECHVNPLSPTNSYGKGDVILSSRVDNAVMSQLSKATCKIDLDNKKTEVSVDHSTVDLEDGTEGYSRHHVRAHANGKADYNHKQREPEHEPGYARLDNDAASTASSDSETGGLDGIMVADGRLHHIHGKKICPGHPLC